MSLSALLAEELEISEDQAQALLESFAGEIKQRTDRGKTVRVPKLGTFRKAAGRLAFESSPFLARSVNHEFAGLDAEEVASDVPADEEHTAETLARGLKTGAWAAAASSKTSKNESEESAAAAAEATTAEAPDRPAPSEPAVDTEPSAEPASSASEGAEEASARPDLSDMYPVLGGSEPADETQASRSEPAPDEPSSTDAVSDPGPPPSSTSTENAAGPSPEETSAKANAAGDESPDEPSAFEDDDFDERTNFWASDDWDLPSSSAASDDSSSGDAATGAAAPSGTEERQPEMPGASAPPTPAPDEAAGSDRAPQPSDAPAKQSGIGWGTITALLLAVVVLAGGSWFVLGQAGVVPGPENLWAEWQAPADVSSPTAQPSASGSSGTLSNQAAPAAATSGTPAVSPGTSAPQETTATSRAAPEEASARSPAVSPAPAVRPGAPLEFAETAEGWTLIVASRTSKAAAEALVTRYREQLTLDVPVGVITATVDGVTRYRVGIGQLPSRNDVTVLRERLSGQVPSGAWPLRL
ncbi:SPOR domain-containing protein [Salisaeta longa]|uniref:SPOR domain-containing protein n=1 Tax=Salisaeta longa TaxID=503170 RepID=UPI0003B7163E|nr:SPOR domain-containing protein [Salisaeta longa]